MRDVQYHLTTSVECCCPVESTDSLVNLIFPRYISNYHKNARIFRLIWNPIDRNKISNAARCLTPSPIRCHISLLDVDSSDLVPYFFPFIQIYDHCSQKCQIYSHRRTILCFSKNYLSSLCVSYLVAQNEVYS